MPQPASDRPYFYYVIQKDGECRIEYLTDWECAQRYLGHEIFDVATKEAKHAEDLLEICKRNMENKKRGV